MNQVAELKRKIIESFAEIGVGVRVKMYTKEGRRLNVACDYVHLIVLGMIDEYNRVQAKGIKMLKLEQELEMLKISKSTEVESLRQSLASNNRLLNKSVVLNVIFVTVILSILIVWH